MNRQDVTRQQLKQFSRVLDTRERPIDTLSASLLPVRAVELESTSVKQDTHDPHGTTNPHPGTPVMELLEVQPPGSAHARAKKFFGVVP